MTLIWTIFAGRVHSSIKHMRNGDSTFILLLNSFPLWLTDGVRAELRASSVVRRTLVDVIAHAPARVQVAVVALARERTQVVQAVLEKGRESIRQWIIQAVLAKGME